MRCFPGKVICDKSKKIMITKVPLEPLEKANNTNIKKGKYIDLSKPYSTIYIPT